DVEEQRLLAAGAGEALEPFRQPGLLSGLESDDDLIGLASAKMFGRGKLKDGLVVGVERACPREFTKFAVAQHVRVRQQDEGVVKARADPLQVAPQSGVGGDPL